MIAVLVISYKVVYCCCHLQLNKNNKQTSYPKKKVAKSKIKMKNLLNNAQQVKSFIVMICMLLVVGCSKDDNMIQNIDDSEQSMLDAKAEKTLDYLVNAYGYDRDSIHVGDQYFAVDHVLYPKTMDIPETNDTNLAARGSTYTLLPGSKVTRVNTIVVNIAPLVNLPSVYIDAMEKAIEKWNDMSGFSKTFVLQQNNQELASGGINVRYFDFTTNSNFTNSWSASTEYPVNGYPSHYLYINSAQPETGVRAINTMMHELGHSINFDHTIDRWWWSNEYSCEHATSIMYKNVTNYVEFNSCDEDYFSSYY